MRTIGNIPRLNELALRTVEYRDGARHRDALRQIADAAMADPWGRAVEVQITTSTDDAPEDAR